MLKQKLAIGTLVWEWMSQAGGFYVGKVLFLGKGWNFFSLNGYSTCLGLAALLFQAWSQNQSRKFVAVSCTMLIEKLANDTLAWVWMLQHGFSQRKSIIWGWHFSAWMATRKAEKSILSFLWERKTKTCTFWASTAWPQDPKKVPLSYFTLQWDGK